MIQVLFSPTAQLVVPLEGEARGVGLDGRGVAKELLRASLSFAGDWRVADVTSIDNLADLLHESRVLRAQQLTMDALEGLSERLTVGVLESIEEMLVEGVTAREIATGLALAPLRNPKAASRLSEIALAHNLSAIGWALNEIAGFQPLLARFASVWLRVPESMFLRLGTQRTRIWNQLAARGMLRQLFEAPGQVEFNTVWTGLVVLEQSPADRVALMELCRHLSGEIYGQTHNGRWPEPEEAAQRDDEPIRSERLRAHQDVLGRRDRALKQIDGIAKAVANGDDARANRYLRELVASQQRIGDTKYAVISLCNLAQRCADLYRADFERTCLRKALDIGPADAWTWVQWGDHLKRTGDFPGALDALRKADELGEPVARSAMADVFAQKGEYERALAEYRGIPGFETNNVLQTAYADVTRFSGRYDEALTRYQALLSRLPDPSRAWAGIAEIRKSRGDFEGALQIYNQVTSRPLLAERDEAVFRAARCQLLKVTGRLSEAFEEADGLVSARPFDMGARVLRASILALLNREEEVISELESTRTPFAFGEWRQAYLQGLLLLKLRRFDQARTALTSRLEKSAVSTGDDLLRWAAAFAYLQATDSNVSRASAILRASGPGDSLHERYLRQVLELHIATLKRDEKHVHELWEALEGQSRLISGIVLALKRKDYRAAVMGEMEMFLMAA